MRRTITEVAMIAACAIGAMIGSTSCGGVASEPSEDSSPDDWRAIVHESLVAGPGVPADAPREAPREEIHAPLALEGLPSDVRDVHGREIPIACDTCHAPDGHSEGLVVPAPRAEDEPDAPHAGFRFDHGERPCTACHDDGDRSRLRLADGTSLPMREAMQLCAQCHGPQYRAYRHGAHGGMRGHWDSERGPRLRNHCVDCHDPHAPAIPPVAPMPAPRDRFRPASGDHAERAHD